MPSPAFDVHGRERRRRAFHQGVEVELVLLMTGEGLGWETKLGELTAVVSSS